jgi:hypothetical protein
MAPRSGNRQGRIAAAVHTETKFGFVQESREIKHLGRFQARIACLRPDLRLN